MENQHETIVPSVGKEMNFFDLCVACVRAMGRGCAAVGRLLGKMLRLTYRYWWLVLTLVFLAAAAAIYYTRPLNTIYRVNAIALLNGPSVQQFEQAYAPLRSGQMLPDELALKELVRHQIVKRFETYRVVDCLNDSVADYIDFHHHSSATDTVKVQMQDRLCLQFRIKARDMHLLPGIEQELLAWLNSSPALQRSYETYLRNLQSDVAFNHSQVQKLDSLTDQYYFHNHLGSEPLTGISNGVVWVGDWRVHLFLTAIYSHQSRTNKMDQRLQLAAAPVTLENHFAADPSPVNGRWKFLFLFVLLGWIGGCVIAEIIDKRKAIVSWLKQ